jgi:hypothetical protein
MSAQFDPPTKKLGVRIARNEPLEHDEIEAGSSFRHCEERSDEAIHPQARHLLMDCFTRLRGFAMASNTNGPGS